MRRTAWSLVAGGLLVLSMTAAVPGSAAPRRADIVPFGEDASESEGWDCTATTEVAADRGFLERADAPFATPASLMEPILATAEPARRPTAFRRAGPTVEAIEQGQVIATVEAPAAADAPATTGTVCTAWLEAPDDDPFVRLDEAELAWAAGYCTIELATLDASRELDAELEELDVETLDDVADRTERAFQPALDQLIALRELGTPPEGLLTDPYERMIADRQLVAEQLPDELAALRDAEDPEDLDTPETDHHEGWQDARGGGLLYSFLAMAQVTTSPMIAVIEPGQEGPTEPSAACQELGQRMFEMFSIE